MTAKPVLLSLDRMDPSLVETLNPIVGRLGYLGELFQYLGHAPGSLIAFLSFSRSVNASIPPNLNEVLALTVCSSLDLPYERIQHERLSVKLGFDRAWIAALVGQGDLDLLSPEEATMRGFALALANGRDAEASKAVNALAVATDEKVAMAALLQGTRFMAICTMGRVLGVSLPVDSIFAESAGT